MVKKILFISFLIVSSFAFSQEKSIQKLAASPNPFINTTTITFNSTNKQDVFIRVKNVLGKTVFSQRITVQNGKNELSFNRNSLKSGMYIYAIQTKKGIISKRFVIR